MRGRGLLLLALLVGACAPRAPAYRGAATPEAPRRESTAPASAGGYAIGAASAPPTAAAPGWWASPPGASASAPRWGLVTAGGPIGAAAGTSSPAGQPAAGSSEPGASSRPERPRAAATEAEPPAGSAPAASGYAAPDEDEIEDDVEELAPPPAAPDHGTLPPPALPRDAEIQRKLAQAPASLGPMSLGAANGGALFNAIELPPSTLYDIIDRGHAWATRETIDYLTAALRNVHARFPDAPKMQVGHLSAKLGGPLKPHRSHQSGRDVDVSFYYRVKQPGWYRRANGENLDREKTWAFVRALLTETDVEYIFINTSLQQLLKEHALQIGEDPGWLDSVFQVGSKRADPIIRHAKGHDTHIHVRFYNPIAQELGRRAYPYLLAAGRIKPAQYFVQHRAVKGDTLGALARRYGTTVAAIQQANHLRGTAIVAKQVYRIPRERASVPQMGPIRVPPRRLPPMVAQESHGGAARPGATAAP
jgi:penicillin-insensitive murein endopeptidase